MTLESRSNKNRYIGNGEATDFPFTFKVWKTDQVKVFVGDGNAENEVSGECIISITATGGTVSFPVAPSYGSIVVIRRSMPYIQEDDYRNGTRFDSEEVEDRFDQDCAERQDLRLDVDRSVKVPLTSALSPEEYEQEFWDAYADTLSKHAAVAGMHADVMAERPLAIAAVRAEGDYQLQRLQSFAGEVIFDSGSSCMEMAWELSSGITANDTVDVSPLSYIVGRHHVRVSLNGVVLYRNKQWEEVGEENERSQAIKTLLPLNIGDVLNVWIGTLASSQD